MAVDSMPGHQGIGMPEGGGLGPSRPALDGADGERADTTRTPGIAPPAITLPKGGGAVRGIGEKFSANPATGTASLSIPLPVSPGRSGFGPSLTLSYDSSNAHGPFGMGWTIGLPSITRKTDKGLPTYDDAGERDVFLLSGEEDLVPVSDADGNPERPPPRTVDGVDYVVIRYRPRVEGLFSRIERWTREDGDIHWRSISRNNITTLYGRDDNSRIFDPADRRRVFSWLICESYDDKGNAIEYTYKREDSTGVGLATAHERHRNADGGKRRTANRYLKSVRYGNRVSRLVPPPPADDGWLFELVFDYGEYDADTPTPADTGRWLCRNDPFSSYRAGFEIRTYRLCRRILMFHHVPGEAGVGANCLVRSMSLCYRSSRGIEADRQRGHPAGAFLESVTVAGHRRHGDGYLARAMPPIELEYSIASPQPEVHEVDSASLENLPMGLDGSSYLWVDLDGESISGVLIEQSGGWFYKPNLGGGRFGFLQTLPSRPSASIGGGQAQLLDLAGDGRLDVVSFGGSVPGFFERTEEGSWAPQKAFASLPALDWSDPTLRLVDLNGDGHADVLITEDDAIVFYPSLAEDGFGPAVRVPTAPDDDAGPRLVFADGTQSVYLADFSGDGLADLARIRNGEVCYWPNLGYGRFGAKVVMDGAPWFDRPDQFDHRRLHLADLDGTGPTDMVYITGDGVDLYANQMGNGWSRATQVAAFPPVDDLTSVAVVDLLGRGTACLVWSSPLPGVAGRHVRYVDLFGRKPHLLTRVKNNLGSETVVTYASSTEFYLTDKIAGQPWITRLPFPVQVVERVETFDQISRNRFVTRYAYHHGYFDGIEREFRGFGRVDEVDTEEFAVFDGDGRLASNLDEASHVPPILTKTWYHTGASFEGGAVSRQFEQEYYPEPGATPEDLLLPDTVLPASVRPTGGERRPYVLSVEEEMEARRALKGSVLRQEIYALDGTAEPYTVSERNYTIELVQPITAGNRRAIVFTHPRETVEFHYERRLRTVGGITVADPRVSHSMTLDVDSYGNELMTAAIAYGRRHDDVDLSLEDQGRQQRGHVTYTANRYTNPVEDADAYRVPLVSETCSYELLNVTPATPDGKLLSLGEVARKVAQAAAADEVPFEDHKGSSVSAGSARRRKIEHVRTLYRRDDLTGPLSLGGLQPLALPFASYRLAFTTALLSLLYKRGTKELLPVPAAILGSEGGYEQSDSGWWIPSGLVFYSEDPAHSPAQELAAAKAGFFLPVRFRDPFGQDSHVVYDAPYTLLVRETRDQVGNQVGAILDYRVLQPRLVTDPNGNRMAAAFDAFGLIVGTAVMGKPSETAGDSLDGFITDLTDAEIAEYLGDPSDNPHALLGRATTRFVYDLFAYRRTRHTAQPVPPVVATLSRETHHADLKAGQKTRIHHRLIYSDGFGREIQSKLGAEPDPSGVPRWVGSGWTIYNNKGNPVRRYQPFFSPTARCEFDKKAGPSSILLYDPLQRVVATVHPNRTYEKVIFDAWHQVTWDVNDTVLQEDPRSDPDVGALLAHLSSDELLPTWYTRRKNGALGAEEQAAAVKAAVHAATPARAHLDSLGRTFCKVAHNKFWRDGSLIEERHVARQELDVEGNVREVLDARNRVVMRYDYDLLGNLVRSTSMEAGARWSLADVLGKPIYNWDSLDRRVRTRYDAARRPTEVRLLVGSGSEALVEKIVYGEPQGAANNMRGKPYQMFDAAGRVTNGPYDFKGNLKESRRELTVDYRTVPDWLAAPALEPAFDPSKTAYDALNRPSSLTTPDGSTTVLSYNNRGLLQKISTSVRGAAYTEFVSNIQYNARGQRTLVEYGNGTRTTYGYDDETFRLMRLRTRRDSATFSDDCPDATKVPCGIQNLGYTYDSVGNVTHIRNDAQETIFFRNARVEPVAEYTYDAIYRLIDATGREHLGQIGGSPAPTSHTDEPRVRLTQSRDRKAMGLYSETYTYDMAGNLTELAHRGSDPAHSGWTRLFQYDEISALEPTERNNQLSQTRLRGSAANATYRHDNHGNMIGMPHLTVMRWDHRDQLQATAQTAVAAGKTPEITYYVYDSAGQRIRKVTDRQAGPSPNKPTRMKERIYLGGVEFYREYSGTGITKTLERQTLHVMDDSRRIALVESRTVGNDSSPSRVDRYQLSNHLDSASLELSDTGMLISYEEYYPYGGTACQMAGSRTKTPKRYRYTSKERDEESGLYYYGTRYYASWICRFISADRVPAESSPNSYRFVSGNPLSRVDDEGRADSAPPMLVGGVNLFSSERSARLLTPNDWQRLPAVPRGTSDVMAAFLAQYNPKALLPRVDNISGLMPAPAKPQYRGPIMYDANRADFEAFLGRQGPFNAAKNRMMQEAIQAPLISASMPLVSAFIGGALLGAGTSSLVKGDYDLAKQQLLLSLGYLAGGQASNQYWSRVAAYRRIGGLQDELTNAAMQGNKALRGKITVSVGVGIDDAGNPITIVSTNAGAPKDLVARVRQQLGSRALFVEGSGHAEVNVIQEGGRLGLWGMRTGASNYHCVGCQMFAAQRGATLVDPNAGFRLNPRIRLIEPTSVDPSAADYLARDPLFPSLYAP